MLSNLRVKNFAIIDNITIDFNNGFTVLTGETGAGKSLIIDAIGLLFGERSSTSIVRNGELKAIVEGVFENLSENTKIILEEIGVESLEDDILVIKREINASGKSIVRVNGEIVTLSQLDLLAKTLGDIHTQDDTKKLFLPENYLTFIDNSESLEELNKYRDLRKIYLNNLKEHEKLVNSQDDIDKNHEFWLYQYNELSNANLKVNEIEELEKELEFLNNFEVVYKLLLEIRETLDDNDICDSLYKMVNLLEKLSKYNENYRNMYEMLNDAYYNIDDLSSSIKDDFNHLEFDEERLNEINERISFLKGLTKKYRTDLLGLIKLKEELKEKIDNVDNIEVYIEDSKKLVENSYNNLCHVANKLSNIRKINAKLVVNNIQETLKDLLLDKVLIEIRFNEYNLVDYLNSSMFYEDGCDVIDIFVSFNVGENLKPLSKVASGGELSRVMLALKVNMLDNLHLSTMIFDEIDSGVSGEAAAGVASKMKEISKKTQVLAITHLPIVASFADNQMLITKDVINDRTSTKIVELSFEERVNVLAKMISPNDVTNKSKELARSWLEK